MRQMLQGLNIWHRTKWGFGRRERLKAKDEILDELVAKLEATTAAAFQFAAQTLARQSAARQQ